VSIETRIKEETGGVTVVTVIGRYGRGRGTTENIALVKENGRWKIPFD
jgi:hypothetical protein